MADAIEINEHREEQQEMTSSKGSGSVALQSGNSSNLRLRRPPLVGYSSELLAPLIVPTESH